MTATASIPAAPPFAVRARIVTPLGTSGGRHEADGIVEVDARGRITAVEAAEGVAAERRDGAIDLRPSCGTWTGSTPGPVNCAALRQVEARYGDGDGVYTLDEQTTALNAFYDRFNGPQGFYDQPRHIRLGLELKF